MFGNRLVSNSDSCELRFQNIHVEVCIVIICATAHCWLSGGVGGSCIMFDRTCAKRTDSNVIVR